METRKRAKERSGTASWKCGLAVLLFFNFLVLIALAGSPSLHEWIHHDCGSADHNCAVTVFLSGQYHVPAVDILVRVPRERIFPVCFQEPSSEWLGSFFLICRVLEHAPPLVVNR